MQPLGITLDGPLEGVTTGVDCAPFSLRAHEPGDMDWVVQQHRREAEEHGFDGTFVAMIAGLCDEFLTHFNPQTERCWIAEMDGRVVGCVFCVQVDPETAKLRMLVVDPTARGLGVGRRLVAECVSFARRVGYRRLVLWTHSILVSARRLYAAAGFTLLGHQPRPSFGQDLVEETWELVL